MTGDCPHGCIAGNFSIVFTSIWTDGRLLAIGCDQEVVIVHLADMDVEYWTELGEEEVAAILKKKHKSRYHCRCSLEEKGQTLYYLSLLHF